jgi:hypothetical protein
MALETTTKRSEIVADELRQVIGALTRRLRVKSAGHQLSVSEQAILRRLLEVGPATTAALAIAEKLDGEQQPTLLAAVDRLRQVVGS